jgi:small redox-active disulfide protein 2
MAARQLGLEYELEKVTDMAEITGFGVMVTPALVMDGKVLFSGKTPSVEELKEMLS